eukprot:4748943-Ditylum_brightwellii.AAC.1
MKRLKSASEHQHCDGDGNNNCVARDRKKLIKWEFYFVPCEEMMTFVSPDEATTTVVENTLKMNYTSHLPTHASLVGKK